MSVSAASVSAPLRAAGLGDGEIAAWIAAERSGTADYDSDCARYSQFWGRSDDLISRLPPKPARSAAEAAAAEAIFAPAREHRERFLAAHGEAVYERLTHARTRFMRLEDLVVAAAVAVVRADGHDQPHCRRREAFGRGHYLLRL